MFTVTIQSDNWVYPVVVRYNTKAGGGHNTTIDLPNGGSISSRESCVEDAVRFALDKIGGHPNPGQAPKRIY